MVHECCYLLVFLCFITGRIRSLGSWLSKTQKSEIVESDGSGMELLEHMRQRLSTIEQELGGVMEHIEECYRSLNKVDKLKGILAICMCAYIMYI